MAVWIGCNANLVANRRAAKAAIASHGGWVELYQAAGASTSRGGAPGMIELVPRPKPAVSVIRKWLGDVPVGNVVVRQESDLELARQRFPESLDIAFIEADDPPAPQVGRP